ncbi:MAG: PAS domain S-box protein [Spirochaetes bacterium]|nr:PAS domain S-box protein [Spirochaetota bacterium]
MYIYLGVFIINKNYKELLNQICFCLMMCFALLSFSKIFLHNPYSSEMIIPFMKKMAEITSISFSPLVLLLALVFTKHEKILKNKLFLVIIILLPILFYLLQIVDPYILLIQRGKYQIFVMAPNFRSLLFGIFYISLVVISVAIAYQYLRRAESDNEKKYSQVYIITSVIALTLGTITDAVLPFFKIYIFPDMGNLFGLIWAVGIAYSIIKYKFFLIPPRSVADSIINTMSDGLIVLDKNRCVKVINQAALQILDLEEKEIKFQSISMIFPDFEQDRAKTLFKRKIKKQNVYITLKAKSGEKIPALFNISRFADAREKFDGFIVVFHDISNIIQYEAELKASQESFQNIVEKTDDGIVVLNPSGKIQFANTAAVSYLNLSQREYFIEDIFSRVVDDGITEVQVTLPNGNYGVGEIKETDTLWENKKAYLLNIRDITRRTQDELLIKKSLKEKEVLLQEIHHRVKNNLQVIHSLLKFSARYNQDEKVANLLRDTRSRIRSMALIHEMLYRTSNLYQINIKDYLEEFIDILKDSYLFSEDQKIIFDTKIENILLEIDIIMPCSLIVNELVSNSLKHAFQGRTEGIIIIELAQKGTYIELVIGDNGIGMPTEINLLKNQSLGLHLVKILVENQLDGNIEISRNGGTFFKISFPRKIITQLVKER